MGVQIPPFAFLKEEFMEEKKDKKKTEKKSEAKTDKKKAKTQKKSAKTKKESVKKKSRDDKKNLENKEKEQIKEESVSEKEEKKETKEKIDFDRIDEIISKEDNSLKREKSFSIPSESFFARLDEKAKSYREKVKLKGFRKGKVPLEILKRYFYKELKEEVIDDFIRDKLREILKSGEKIAVYPAVSKVNFDEKKGLSFVIVYEVLPEFTVENYRGVEVKNIKEPEYEKMIEAELERLRAESAVLEPIEKGKKIENEETFADVEVQIRNLSDGKWLKKFKYPVPYLKNVNFLNLKEELIGMSVGDEKIYRTKTEENFPIKSVAAKEVEVRVKVLSASKLILPEINDDFAKSLGEYESLDALKKAIKEALEKKYIEEKEYKLGEEVVEKLSETIDFPLPPSYILDEINHLRRANPQISPDEAYSKARKIIKGRFILSKIAELEKIEAKEEDVLKFIEVEAKRYGIGKEQYLKSLKEDDIERIRDRIIIDKTVRFLGKNANVV